LLYNSKTKNFMALSPNIDLESVKKPRKLSMFYYSPGRCLSMEFLESGKNSQLVISPREQPFFLEGIDNLTPVDNL
jgi:hypothetical protein